MGSGQSSLVRFAGSLPALMLFLLCPAPAFAHKLNVFALAKGATIEGRAYFTGDVPARKIDVIVRDPAGGELGRTTTDDDGKFTFTARKRVDHCLLAETADGHSGQYIVPASELPDSLPADVPATGDGSQVESPTTDHAGPPVASANKENELRDQLTELSKQVDALRWQIDKSDERLRFRDMLGGIGFILGLAGVAFYRKARQNKR